MAQSEQLERGARFMPFEFETGRRPPELLFGYVSVRSQGKSVLEAEAGDLSDTEQFVASTEDHSEAARILESAGLDILVESRLGKAVAGPPEAFEELTGGTVVTKERLLRAEAGRDRYVTHVDIVGAGQPPDLGVGAASPDQVEAVLLERPRLPHAVFPSPIPPPVQKYHLRVPDDVAFLLGALASHRSGQLGEGVTVAMVDTGQYPHPYFLAHGYDVQEAVTVVRGTRASDDPIGHGTGESANIFAVAPAATLRPYRASNNKGDLVAAIGGFLQAKADRPDVLTNSWGGGLPYPPAGPPDRADVMWAAEIRDAVEQGILVVFSAGNGHFSIEPQVPGVLAAGGAFVGPDLSIQASNYASGYDSPWFEGVTVPTVCGLVGLLPRAQYLMLPVPPRCAIDTDESEAAPGDAPDGTAPNDGWALFSGTSAAAPQLAGAAALVLGAHRTENLRPPDVITRLTQTAIDVTVGRCNPNFNNLAGPGRDPATGFGLVDVGAAAA
jgi:subtilisin family serine protease